MTTEPTTESRPAADAPDAGAPARPLPACPLCGVQLLVLSECCQSCGGELAPLPRVVEMADAYFNQAVAAARKGEWWQAAEHLAVTLALRADDVEALVLLGKVRGHGKQPALAVSACQEALRLAPDRADAKLVLDRFSR
jgi:cytochrome c-type biogenesis protein CcmH/NrfG